MAAIDGFDRITWCLTTMHHVEVRSGRQPANHASRGIANARLRSRMSITRASRVATTADELRGCEVQVRVVVTRPMIKESQRREERPRLKKQGAKSQSLAATRVGRVQRGLRRQPGGVGRRMHPLVNNHIDQPPHVNSCSVSFSPSQSKDDAIRPGMNSQVMRTAYGLGPNNSKMGPRRKE